MWFFMNKSCQKNNRKNIKDFEIYLINSILLKQELCYAVHFEDAIWN